MNQSLKIKPKQSMKMLLVKLGVVSVISLICIAILISFFFKPDQSTANSTVNIQGVINSYAQVTGFTTSTLTINNIDGNLADFSAGRKILIIQMKGAGVATSNDIHYGNITNLNNAGLHEFIRILNVSGSGPYTLNLDGNLLNNYNSPSTSFIQIVSVPQYQNAVVTNTLTSRDWNFTTGTGGIVAFEVNNTLTLDANIDVSGRGFRGALKGGSTGGNNISNTFFSSNTGFGLKGEGITNFISNQRHAKGKLANGGGGGNPHNAGGGGGGNSTYGGNGGNGWTGTGGDNSAVGGIGGTGINYRSNLNRILMGGGGGAGQQNDDRAGNGGNGGGIVLVRSNRVLASSPVSINASGQNGFNSTGNDGAGGGGAGGTIKLDVYNWENTGAVTLNVNGGNGGNLTTNVVHGGGGGGGIGIVQLTAEAYNPNVLVVADPGRNGQDCTSCTTSSGMAPQAPATNQQLLTGVEFPGQMMTLPITLLNFQAKRQGKEVLLSWSTSSEKNNDFFTIEKSKDGKDFRMVGTVSGSGTTEMINNYKLVDSDPYSGVNFYMLKQTDFDGTTKDFPIVMIENDLPGFDAVKVWPNPFKSKFSVQYSASNNDPVDLQIYNTKGIMVYSIEYSSKAGNNLIEFSEGEQLKNDLYILYLIQNGVVVKTLKINKH